MSTPATPLAVLMVAVILTWLGSGNMNNLDGMKQVVAAMDMTAKTLLSNTMYPHTGAIHPSLAAESISMTGGSKAWRLLPVAHAVHEDEGISKYFWDRSTASGHRNLLNCDPPPNDDRCKIPFLIGDSVTLTGLSKSVIFREAIKAASTVNSVTPYIGVQSYHRSDNMVLSKTLSDMVAGTFAYERHCPTWICLHDSFKDSHLVKFTIYLTADRRIPFGTVEVCNGHTPLLRDVEKTLKHEFWHMFGIDHSNLTGSITDYNGYVCGVGDTPDSHDIAVLRAKYPGGVR